LAEIKNASSPHQIIRMVCAAVVLILFGPRVPRGWADC